MTQGLAILSMLVLHLFCRKGADVYGTPLIWLNDTTPLVYCFGFFAEICVPLYSICAGYAQELLALKGGGGEHWKSNLRRGWKLLTNYWIVLCLFCILGLVVAPGGDIPGSADKFIKSVFLIHSYNGAWWYLNTYLILMLLPPLIMLFPVRMMKSAPGLAFSIAASVLWYLVGRFGLFPGAHLANPMLVFARKELVNLLGVLPAFWAGAFLCKGDIVSETDRWLCNHLSSTKRKMFLSVIVLITFFGFIMLEKTVLALLVAIVTFCTFNLWEKSAITKKVFLFLGKHSTNIWLTHMFYYSNVNFGERTKYPAVMLVVLILLCWTTSEIVFAISSTVSSLCGKK